MTADKIYTVKIKIRFPKGKSSFSHGQEMHKWCIGQGLTRFIDYDWGVSSRLQRIWFMFRPEHQQLANMFLWRWA
jgi:hypothetical protein